MFIYHLPREQIQTVGIMEFVVEMHTPVERFQQMNLKRLNDYC